MDYLEFKYSILLFYRLNNTKELIVKCYPKIFVHNVDWYYYEHKFYYIIIRISISYTVHKFVGEGGG